MLLQSKPKVLESKDIKGIAKYIESPKCKKVFFMVGAGISTSAGIPDFRSPDTGLYANLARLNLPYPEAVFDIQYFRRNPKPFYILASELYPGSYRPTPTHSFIRLMADRSLLHTCFTQNIDTLERIAGVPTDKIIEAHGSFATQQCIKCNSPFPDDLMKQHVQDAKIPLCTEKGCKGYVKPDIVFFGQGLPETFFSALGTLEEADLLIIMGTSLTVHPFASLQYMVPPTCPRVLINLDKVGDIGSKADDVVLQMDCDTAVREICDALGQDWRDDLERLWKETEGLYTPRVSKVPAAKPAEEPKRPGKLSGKNNHLADEISRMASRLGEKLSLKDKRPETKPEGNVSKGEGSEEREEVDTVKAGVEGVDKPQGGAESSAEQKEPSAAEGPQKV